VLEFLFRSTRVIFLKLGWNVGGKVLWEKLISVLLATLF